MNIMLTDRTVSVDGGFTGAPLNHLLQSVIIIGNAGTEVDKIKLEIFIPELSTPNLKCTVGELRAWLLRGVTPAVTPSEDAVEVPLAAEVPLASDEPRQYLADPVRDALTGIMHAGVSL
jgi:hypothetical protein